MKKKIVILILIMLLISLFSVLFYNISKTNGNLNPPPPLSSGLRVYVSSPLFNMSDLFYSIGINGLQSTTAGSIASDNIQSSDMGYLGQILSTNMGIPLGGVAEAIAKRGWESYIPARDGFNLVLFAGSTATYWNNYISAVGTPEYKKLKSYGLVEADQELIGTYLLMAVYSFDMYNLTERCNCFLFNSGGITMDAGSVVELGIANARGLPVTIHAPEDVTLFAGGIVNPMVAGCSGYNLTTTTWKFYDINLALDDLENKCQQQLASGKEEWTRNNSFPKRVEFWATLGRRVWNLRFKGSNGLVTDESGATMTKESLTDIYFSNFKSPSGAGYLGAIICGIVKQILVEFNIDPIKPPIK